MKSIYHVRKVVFLSTYCTVIFKFGRSRGVKTGSSNKHGGTWYAFVLQTYHVLLSSTISTISEVIIK